MGAAAIGGGIAAAGALGGSLISSSGAQDAAQTQADAANQASANQLAEFNKTQANLQPYQKAGTNSLTALLQGLGLQTGQSGNFANGSLVQKPITPLTAAQFQSSPGYQWQLQQGENAIQNSAAAGAGGGLGGNTLQALLTYGQGLANQDWQQAYNNNYNNQIANNQVSTGNLNSLLSLIQGGQNAATNVGNFGANVQSQIGANTIGAGNALAAGQVGSANAFNSLLNNSSLQNSVSGLFNNLFSGSSGSSAWGTPLDTSALPSGMSTSQYYSALDSAP